MSLPNYTPLGEFKVLTWCELTERDAFPSAHRPPRGKLETGLRVKTPRHANIHNVKEGLHYSLKTLQSPDGG